jgi:tRNA dimethylallyltransferase
MRGVPHYLLDVASPKRQFSVAQFKKQAERAIADILSRGKLPILCGGTGFYIQAVVDNIMLPEVAPDKKLRVQLEQKTTQELFAILKKLDPQRAKEIDRYNPRRLIRAIEIARTLGSIPRNDTRNYARNYDILQVGLDMPDKILRERIHVRLAKRMRSGMLAEAKRLHAHGLSWKRMEELGLEYRHLARLLQEKTPREEMLEKLETEIWHYAKRQRTWFRRDKRIHWFLPKDDGRIKRLTKDFLAR